MHTDKEDDDAGQIYLGLCAECAKDEELRNFVTRNCGLGICGFCREQSPNITTDEVSENLSGLLRALLRLHFDEYTYNPHWGGNDVQSLFKNENPILDHSRGIWDADEAWHFLAHHLTEPTYPGYDEGVCIYAGHHDGIRMLQFSLNNRSSDFSRELHTRLVRENHYDIVGDVLSWLQENGDRLERKLEKGCKFWRARNGYQSRFVNISDPFGDEEAHYKPYLGASVGAPPPNIVTAGRTNRPNVSHLYLASDSETAVAEIRPHPGDHVSVGKFELLDDQAVIDFSAARIAEYSSSDKQLDLFHAVLDFEKALSRPVNPNHQHLYSITQLLADGVRQLGFEGIAFKSSVGSGENLCLFQPKSAGFQEAEAAVYRVTDLKYDLKSEPVLHGAGDGFREIK